MPNPDFAPTDLAYAAGIIDGEGSILISQMMPNGRDRKSPYIQARVTVAMSDPRVPQWLADTFGGKASTSHSPSKQNNKPVTVWRLNSNAAADFCALIRPYMRLKHRQADLLCELLANPVITVNREGGRGNRLTQEEIALRLDYWERMRALNREGRAWSDERMAV